MLFGNFRGRAKVRAVCPAGALPRPKKPAPPPIRTFLKSHKSASATPESFCSAAPAFFAPPAAARKPRGLWPDGRKFPKDRKVKKRVQRKSTFKNCGILKKWIQKNASLKTPAPNFKNSGFKNPNFKNRGRENRCKKAKLSAEIAVFLLKFQRKNPRRKHEKAFCAEE